MKSLILKILFFVGVLAATPLLAHAEEVKSEDYNAAYDACYEKAEAEQNEEAWQRVFSDCMSEKGFGEEQQNLDSEEDSTDTEW